MGEVNDYVGAVQKADDDTVWIYGYGKYVGDEVPCRGFLQKAQITNPCIVLDNGSKVYGFECWWGDAAEMKKFIGDRNIVEVAAPEDK